MQRLFKLLFSLKDTPFVRVLIEGIGTFERVKNLLLKIFFCFPISKFLFDLNNIYNFSFKNYSYYIYGVLYLCSNWFRNF